jgi:ribosomal protein L11 methyltransferase
MPFWQLTVPASPETSEALTNFLWEQGALGVLEEETPPAPARLRAFFPESASSGALLGAVGAYRASLRALGLALAPAEPEIAPLLDEAWASAWQQSFPPRAVGERLLVTPPWAAADRAAGDRIRIEIEPGRAFGTGHHGSTEGCLVLLERALRGKREARVLDVGTGSGILAVAAVKLGAASVTAIDVDPDAIAAAEVNAARNGCADRVALAIAGPEAVVDGPFPVVVANLLAHTHLALLARYHALVEPGGSLILGGILADEDGPLVEALGVAGFPCRERLVVEEWSSLLCGHAPPAPAA